CHDRHLPASRTRLPIDRDRPAPPLRQPRPLLVRSLAFHRRRRAGREAASGNPRRLHPAARDSESGALGACAEGVPRPAKPARQSWAHRRGKAPAVTDAGARACRARGASAEGVMLHRAAGTIGTLLLFASVVAGPLVHASSVFAAAPTASSLQTVLFTSTLLSQF